MCTRSCYLHISAFRVVKNIPDGSAVVFIFGEIDCREGLLLAVEKLRYDNVTQGAERTIGIFIKVMT